MNFKKVLIGLVVFSSASAYANQRSIEFPIAGNQYCDPTHVSELSLSISNLSESQSTIKLELFKIDGSALESSGTANNGIQSQLELGHFYPLNGRATTTFHLPFGKGNLNCSDRVYHGKITVNNLNGRIISSGFISSRKQTPMNPDTIFISSAPITVNEGKPF